METLIKKIPLKNGLIISIYDHTVRYYGDFYLVKIEIVCEIPLRREYFENENEYDQAWRILGENACYRRFMEQMGVPSTGIERAREIIIKNFVDHSLPYFSSENFPGKFVLSQYRKARNKLNRLPG
ncbi:MAG TPA: hypothetical protein VFG19_09130 [Geobacteraceae bacterium]|nr:hypothetical protein [Geobacteraceae bacterium]